jgi:hypothetical protein
MAGHASTVAFGSSGHLRIDLVPWLVAHIARAQPKRQPQSQPQPHADTPVSGALVGHGGME